MFRYALAESPSGVGVSAPLGYTLVSNGDGTWNAAPGGGSGGVQTVFGRPGPNVLAEVNDYNSDQIANLSSVVAGNITEALNALDTTLDILNSDDVANASSVPGLNVSEALNNVALTSRQPFRATYFVDPLFVGINTGSSSNPFTTIAAAFALALTLGIDNAVICIASNTTVTENVVFPTTGKWEIKGLSDGTSGTGSVINGTVNISHSQAGGFCLRALTNLTVTGAITGVSSGTARGYIQVFNCTINSTITLTTTAQTWRGLFIGLAQKGVSALGGSSTGAVSIAGSILASDWYFGGVVSFSESSWTDNTDFGANPITVNSAAAVNLTLKNLCDFTGIPAFTVVGGGSLTVISDSGSLNRLLTRGMAVTGIVNLRSWNAQASTALGASNNNIAATNVQGGRTPRALMVAEASLTLLTPGTTGSAVLNIIYTDLTGVVRTKPVATALNIAGVVGDTVSGVLPFSHNGATTIQYSVTGIVTPGPLSYQVELAVRQAN